MMPTSYNCSCDDDYDSRTLAQVVGMVMAGLGFIDPITGAPSKTLAELRESIIERLGLPDPLGAALARTLEEARNAVARAMGYASMLAGMEEGTSSLITQFVNEAQQVAWRRLELDSGAGSPPPVLVNGTDVLVLDHVLVEEMAIALAKAHIGHQDAKGHMDLAERYLADTAARRPPGLTQLIDGALKAARASVARRYEMGGGAYALTAFEADGDQTVIDYFPVETLGLAMIKSKVGHTDAKLIMEELERYMQGIAARMPPNAKAVVTQNVIMAQEQAYHEYDVFRTERYFEWPMQQGVQFYDLAANADVCTKRLDPRKVSWVGISQVDGQWVPLRNGIDSVRYGFASESIPSRYEIRQCIEVWPAPSDDTWTLRIKGHFGLMPFAADADTTTIDWQSVYLLALANCKAFYKQGDASTIGKQFERHVYNLVAGSHHTARYLPGDVALVPEPVPLWTSTGWPS
jgi:hypothetical protein